MKTYSIKKKLQTFFSLICFILIFFSCNKDEVSEIVDNGPKGEISISTKSLRDGGNDLLGYGYDCRYALADNISGSGYKYPVIDLGRYNGRIDVGKPLLVEYKELYGSTYTEFEKNMSAGISSTLSADQLGFVKWGVIQLSSEYDSKINQKTNYSFYKTDICMTVKNLKLGSKSASTFKPFLTSNFTSAISRKNAKDLIDIFGTHVMTEIAVGAKLSILVSANTSKSNQSEFAKFNSDIKALVKGEIKANTVNVRNLSDVSVSIKISNGPYVPEVKAVISADGTVTGLQFDWAKWVNGVTENNGGMLYSPLNTLIPIWDFIDDPIFKQEVKNEILYRTQANPVPNLIQMKWGDVLYINTNSYTNGGYDFVSFQWFVNDMQISAQDFGQGSYLSINGKLPFNVPYYFVGLTRDGKIIKSTTVIPRK